jgi:hypothetical protein
MCVSLRGEYVWRSRVMRCTRTLLALLVVARSAAGLASRPAAGVEVLFACEWGNRWCDRFEREMKTFEFIMSERQEPVAVRRVDSADVQRQFGIEIHERVPTVMLSTALGVKALRSRAALLIRSEIKHETTA